MKSFKHILLFLTLWFLVHEFSIIYDGLSDENIKSDYAIIYGNTVNVDGSLSERLIARLEKGKELYLSSKIDKIFVSGGLGEEGFYEGSKMKEYLISKGIISKDIIVDDFGNNTRLTAINFKSKFPNVQSVVVVSQFFHISRAKLSLKQVGIKNVSGVHSDFYEIRDFYSLIREFFGYYNYLLIY